MKSRLKGQRVKDRRPIEIMKTQSVLGWRKGEDRESNMLERECSKGCDEELNQGEERSCNGRVRIS